MRHFISTWRERKKKASGKKFDSRVTFIYFYFYLKRRKLIGKTFFSKYLKCFLGGEKKIRFGKCRFLEKRKFKKKIDLANLIQSVNDNVGCYLQWIDKGTVSSGSFLFALSGSFTMTLLSVKIDQSFTTLNY